MIEVADTSLELDQEVKARLYATAGVRELWVIALNDECIHVYRNPSPTGYAAQETVERGARLEILALPDSGSFSVDAILG